MKVSITKEDIEQGRRLDPHACAVSRAVQRAGVSDFCVMGKAVLLSDQRQHAMALLLPEAVQQWIADYDTSKPVGPITFELGLPVPAAACRCTKGHKKPQCPQAGSAARRCPLQEH